MFITDEDYKVVIGDQALKVVSQVSQENRANAETEAMEEIVGYLRPKYNTKAVFIVPDLPLAMDEYGEPIGIPMVYGCQKKLKHNW